jgi:uncharacterized protein YoxC
MGINPHDLPDGPSYGLTVVVSVIMAAISVVAWCFSTFETITHSKETRDQLEKRLDKIEMKIDLLLERKN